MRRRTFRQSMPASWKAEHTRQTLVREARAVHGFSAIMLATIVVWVVGLSWVVFHII